MSAPPRICDFCRTAPADLNYREVVGIEKLRTQQGGVNALIGRETTGRIPCYGCVEKIKAGIPVGQGRLL